MDQGTPIGRRLPAPVFARVAFRGAGALMRPFRHRNLHGPAVTDYRGSRPKEPEMTRAERITVDPAVMGGRPCVRGLRVSVGTVVGLVAAWRVDELERLLDMNLPLRRG